MTHLVRKTRAVTTETGAAIIGTMPEPALVDMLALAEQLARQAGAICRTRPVRLGTDRKADDSLVTDADRQIEAVLIRAIRQIYADHAILGEETFALTDRGAAARSQARYCWVIDPLDGTRNFVAGLPCFATSIAVLQHGLPVVGVVYEPNLDHLYAAVADAGAKRNGETIHVAGSAQTTEIIVGVPSSKDRPSQRIIAEWAATPELTVRNLGSTAMHLALVACGALAGAYCRKSRIWDVAAGVLLVREAGGRVTGPDGQDLNTFELNRDHARSIPVLAASPAFHAALLATVQAASNT